MPEKRSQEDSLRLLFLILILVGSLIRGIREPLFEKSISNVLTMIWGIALLMVHDRISFAIPAPIRNLLMFTVFGLGWCVLCSIFSTYRSSGLLQTAKYLSYVLVFWGAFSIPRRCHPACKKIVLGFLLILAVLGYMELLHPTAPLWNMIRGEITRSMHPRISSAFLWTNQFGLAMVITILWLATSSDDSAFPGKTRARLSIWITLLALLWCMGQTGSRNAWACLMTGSLLFVITKRMTWRMFLFLWLGFLFVVTTFPVPYMQAGLPESNLFPLLKGNRVFAAQNHEKIWSNFSFVNNISKASVSLFDRKRLYKRAWQDMLDHPIVGLGPRGFTESSGKEIMSGWGFNPHNLLLTMGAETGFPGLVLTLLIFADIVWIARKRTNALLLLSLVMLAGQMLDCFLYDNLFCIIWSIVTGLGLKAAYEEPVE